jgi:phospholipase D1/2
VKTGHVVPEISLARVKDHLSLVKGSLVECPLVRPHPHLCMLISSYILLIKDFLIDQKDFVEGPDWIGLNPFLPIYI